jgi:hypothetical protein
VDLSFSSIYWGVCIDHFCAPFQLCNSMHAVFLASSMLNGLSTAWSFMWGMSFPTSTSPLLPPTASPPQWDFSGSHEGRSALWAGNGSWWVQCWVCPSYPDHIHIGYTLAMVGAFTPQKLANATNQDSHFHYCWNLLTRTHQLDGITTGKQRAVARA